MRTENTAKTGNAQILRLGHTSSDQYGTNPRAAKPSGRTARDEKVK